MRIERHQPFRLELAQRLAHRNSAHAKLDADRILAERFSLRIQTTKDPLTNRVGGHARERLPTNREQHEVLRGLVVVALVARRRHRHLRSTLSTAQASSGFARTSHGLRSVKSRHASYF